MTGPDRTFNTAAEETHFGFSRVPLRDKQARVDEVFHKVASRYDLMNDLMSAGLHRVWKDIFAARVKPSRQTRFRHLDVAGGTGDIAFRIAKAGSRRTEITVLDINADMLEVGRQRAAKRRFEAKLDFVEANAEVLPFADNSFDAYTIAFGIRNVPRIDQALAEARRVLKRGGQFLCLEFSNVEMPVLDRLYEVYSFRAIPLLGRLVTGDADSYRYLVESIAGFPDAESFRAKIAAAGLERAAFTRLTGGIVAIHSGWKL
ncbi:bifunctional demethylmenaquinone methyltransferase/2-methoxy-6-polyprenyl-1,4-benzoquinol methylase UbiE [Methylocapsa polymorpha]|uniref:Ubiquinone/menaquinone biosynthesis C-methyltransferase UbiE n=1 Tax=Methylocapsa polymorpha TaxID=3080828 RepID=A0ABZ0HQ44_9HYPH|nr:bifunctional demethylmenaquinone methyltransferase/2-methoxy-6-polyprenyl-1,4-benzoquinol methylase UbiE [Methylocapsa sp. RX1]